MKYLKSFNTESERQSYELSLDFVEPYVSYVEDSDRIYYSSDITLIATDESNPELMEILKDNEVIPSNRTKLYKKDVENLTDEDISELF